MQTVCLDVSVRMHLNSFGTILREMTLFGKLVITELLLKAINKNFIFRHTFDDSLCGGGPVGGGCSGSRTVGGIAVRHGHLQAEVESLLVF